MRIALFSDVHGNMSALRAVLASIDSQGVDEIVFAGDLCLMGANPQACIDTIRQRGIATVMGNTDAWLVGAASPPEKVADMVAWCREQLTDSGQRWLAQQPFARVIQPTADPATALHIVHANPADLNQIIFPSEAAQKERYGEVRQSDDDLESLLENVTAATLAFGHLHIPNVRPWRDKQLVNVSSVNMPGDGDPRAKYVIFNWEDGRWRLEHHRTGYETAPEIAAFWSAQPPGWKEIISQLEKDGYYYPQRV